jgi:stage III sporulation protein AD
MDIFKLIFIAILSTAICIVLKQTRPEFAMFVALATVVIIFIVSLEQIGQVLNLIKELSNKSGMPNTFFETILKIIGISYVVEFASNICKDSGESAIASKIQFAGKCIILILGMTIIGNFVDTIIKII